LVNFDFLELKESQAIFGSHFFKYFDDAMVQVHVKKLLTCASWGKTVINHRAMAWALLSNSMPHGTDTKMAKKPIFFSSMAKPIYFCALWRKTVI
jgi:hypothetical protein